MGVAQALGIRPDQLYRWRAEWKANGAGAFPGKGHVKAEDAEVCRLERELAQVRMERDVLKKH